MKRYNKKSLWNVIFFNVIILPLAILISLSIVTSVTAKDTIKIGQLDPASGTFKFIGDQYHAAIEQAVYEANEAGGVLGKKIELIWADGMMKPEVAVRQGEKLILRDKVDFLCGGTGSHVYLALTKLAQKHNKILVCTGATTDDLTGKKFTRNFFRPGICNTNSCYAIANYLAKQPQTKYYSIHQDYAFGHNMADIFKKRLSALNPNAKIVGEDFTPLGNKNFGPYISKIIASGAEVVYASHIGADGRILLKQASEMGLTKKVLFALFYMDSVTAKLLGEAIKGHIVTNNYGVTIDTPANQAFVQRFHARHKDKEMQLQYPDAFFGNAYNAMRFLFAAIERAGSLDTEKIINTWEGMEFDYTIGKVKMRACDHQLLTPMYIFKIVKVPPSERYFDIPYYISKPLAKFTAEECAVPLGTPGYNPRCK